MTHGGGKLRGELLPLAGALCGVMGAHALSHFVIHRGAILGAIAAGGTVPAWMWGALFAPELLACFFIGWRLTRWRQILLYALTAAVVRQVCELGLHALGDEGHVLEGPREVLLEMPFVALVYVLLMVLASSAGRQERQLDGA